MQHTYLPPPYLCKVIIISDMTIKAIWLLNQSSNLPKYMFYCCYYTVATLNFVYQEVCTSSSRQTPSFYVFSNVYTHFACISTTMMSARESAYLLVHKIEWCYSDYIRGIILFENVMKYLSKKAFCRTGMVSNINPHCIFGG